MSKAKYRIIREFKVTKNLVTGETKVEPRDFTLQKRNPWYLRILLFCDEYEDLWLENACCGSYDTLEEAQKDLEEYLEKQKTKTTYKYEVVWEMK